MAKKVAKKKSVAPKASAKSTPKANAKKNSVTGATKSADSAAPLATPASEKSSVVLSSTVGQGTKESPWLLKTPSGASEFMAYRDPSLDPPALVVIVGKTELRYALRCIEDLHTMLKQHGDWMLLGSADEQKPAKEGSVEAWARSASNPVKGWYGLKKGLRGRFGNYVPPVLKQLGLAEVEDKPKENRMRAV